MNAECVDTNQILADAAADFKLFSSLLSDIEFIENHAACVHAYSREEAVNYLAAGFNGELTQDISACYLQWVPEINRICVRFTESIPIITEADFDYLQVKIISANQAELKRTYNNCYEIDDQYLYQINLEKIQEHWLITGISLTKIK